jgi:hypothetical protein
MKNNKLSILGAFLIVVSLVIYLTVSKNKEKDNLRLISQSKNTITLENKILLCEVSGQWYVTKYRCYIKEKMNKYLIGNNVPWISIANLVKNSKNESIDQSSIIKIENIDITFYINKEMQCIFNPFYDSRIKSLNSAFRNIENIKRDHCLRLYTEVLNLAKLNQQNIPLE